MRILQIGMAGATLTAALLSTGCNQQEKSQGAAASAPPPPQVEVITVGRKDVPVTSDLPARVQAVRTAEVRARVEGVLEKRLFIEGADVTEGTALFLIDPRPLQAELSARKAELAKAEADALDARQTANRYRSLLGGKAVSQQEMDQADARQKQAQADVAAAKAALAKAEIDLDYTHVRAPISGRIGRALVTEGALVGHGEATHLATIEQLDPVLVNFTQSSSEYLRLTERLRSGEAKAADAPVTLLDENGTAYSHPGHLLVTESAIDPETGSVAMRAEFPNPERALLPGQFVRIRLPLAEQPNAIVVPQRAVQTNAQGQMVLMIGPENKVVPKPVEVGGLSGSDWIVTGGLTGGERIILNGVQKVRPGSVVTPVDAQPAGAAPAQEKGAAQ